MVDQDFVIQKHFKTQKDSYTEKKRKNENLFCQDYKLFISYFKNSTHGLYSDFSSQNFFRLKKLLEFFFISKYISISIYWMPGLASIFSFYEHWILKEMTATK